MAGKRRYPIWYQYFRQQRSNARLRGKEFKLTPEQWWKIWQESGHWDERGKGRDKYCMARFGDLGAYEVGNVEIVTNRSNNIDGSTGRLHTKATIEEMKKTHAGVQYCPHKLTGVNRIRAAGLLRRGVPAEEIATKFGISKATVWRSIRRLEAES